jgi:hypothetical protein
MNRLINPAYRTSSFLFTNSFTNSSRQLPFTVDTVVHYVYCAVCANLTIPGIATLAAGFKMGASVDPENADSFNAVIGFPFVAPGAVPGAAPTVYQTQVIHLDAMFIPANTSFDVVWDPNGGLNNISAFFTIGHNPLSEWVNFREPRVNVQIRPTPIPGLPVR